MTLELYTALIAFAFVSSITPGPNNLMLMASGANFGFRRTIPHIFGIGAGFMVMLLLIGMGLKQLFDAYPVSHQILQVFCLSYLIYLAYKIATATFPSAPQLLLNEEPQPLLNTKSKPMTFIQAGLFQWVNPKVWTMALTGLSVYSPTNTLSSVLIVTLTFGAVNLPSVSVWTVLGQQMRRFLTNNRRLRIFNFAMASLLLLSVYPILSS
ncbi:MAG: LysE family translocator [Pseudomonadales bacterium]|nr:LysE family translocator [Pseudomonadales bacterium]